MSKKKKQKQHMVNNTSSANRLTWDDLVKFNTDLLGEINNIEAKIRGLQQRKVELLPNVEDTELDSIWVGVIKTIRDIKDNLKRTLMLHCIPDKNDANKLKAYSGKIDIDNQNQVNLSMDIVAVYNNIASSINTLTLTSIMAYTNRLSILLEENNIKDNKGDNNGTNK